jgi:hypothetical protein
MSEGVGMTSTDISQACRPSREYTLSSVLVAEVMLPFSEQQPVTNQPHLERLINADRRRTRLENVSTAYAALQRGHMRSETIG